MQKLCALFLICCVTACGGIDLAPEVPQGFNLTGEWVLDPERSDATPDFRDGLHGPKKPQSRREVIRMALGSALSFIVHDFQILSANRLEIEQGARSMGIMHVPGVYRDITWGERERGLWTVHAGWELDDLLLISEANDMRVTERLALKGDRLTVTIQVQADDGENTFTRVFNRL